MEFLIICCVCKKIKTCEGQFIKSNIPEGVILSRGYCDDCYQEEITKQQAQKEKQKWII